MASTPVTRMPSAVDRVDEVVDGVRGVDQQALAGVAVADGVDEVDHLLGDRVVDGEVAAGQELAEVEPIVGVVCHPSYASHR